jgi:hypothetical protein
VAVAIFVLIFGAVKLADVASNARHIYQASRSGKAGVDWAWTPVFARAIRGRDYLKARHREKGKRAWLLTVFVDFLFRAPVMAIVFGIGILIVVGTIDATPRAGGCAFPTTATGIDGWLNVAAATMAVLVGMASVFSFLQVLAAGRSTESRGAAGQYLGRSQGRDGRKLLDPVTVALGTIFSLIIAFAALYGALVATHGSWIAASPCHLGPFDWIYFSSSVGATVGFGDISPMASALRVVTTIQMFVFFAVLALFLQALWVSPQRAVGRTGMKGQQSRRWPWRRGRGSST